MPKYQRSLSFWIFVSLLSTSCSLVKRNNNPPQAEVTSAKVETPPTPVQVLVEPPPIPLSKQQKYQLRQYRKFLKNKQVLGRVEVVEIPDFGDFKIESRIDTGAKSCSLHAENITEKIIDGEEFVEFTTYDHEGEPFTMVKKVIDTKRIRSTSGKAERRYVIRETIKIGKRIHKVNINLNDRSKLNFKFLTGRNLLIGNYLVDSSQSHLKGHLP